MNEVVSACPQVSPNVADMALVNGPKGKYYLTFEMTKQEKL